MRAWDFGDLPPQISFLRAGRKLTGYPALVDEGDSVAIRLFDTRDAADIAMRSGVRRLLRIDLKEQMKQLEKSLPGITQAALQLRGITTTDDLRQDLLTAITDRAFIAEDELPRTLKEYDSLKQRARTRLPAVRDAASRMLVTIADEYHRTSLRLSSAPRALNRLVADIRAQLARLVYPGFFSGHATSKRWLCVSTGLRAARNATRNMLQRSPNCGSYTKSAAANCARPH
ncbi:MAG: hypothetical protein DME57_00255 [Verrucomicrobia bacterium]|nr:MAG: hypothetical protein DME57_00255 [Verrucomicrobiota bacterium]